MKLGKENLFTYNSFFFFLSQLRCILLRDFPKTEILGTKAWRLYLRQLYDSDF